ncbi:hypothetical protein INR49_008026 [Caranx melampygus]|nr:hypothetical protein INR49_008026 [Caranx melampygus]
MGLAPSTPLRSDSLKGGALLLAASVSTDSDTLRLRTGLLSNSSLQIGHWGPIFAVNNNNRPADD